MSEGKISKEQLVEVAKAGQKHASESLTKIAGKKVRVETQETKADSASAMKQALSTMEEESIVAYTQAISGVSGTSIISISRERALILVDLLNGRVKGTTVVMQEIDRSTIQETLNILANAYVTELGKLLGEYVALTVPRLVTAGRMDEIVEGLVVDNEKQSILFKTKLFVDEVDFEIELFFHFYFLTSSSKEE